jgi:predicted DNA-binding transcriptional regulator YafY
MCFTVRLPNIREHKWHPSQKILKDCTRRGQDCLEAEYELSDTTEFRRWLLGFGRFAVVLKPKKLADEMKAEFRASCQSYGINCPMGD